MCGWLFHPLWKMEFSMCVLTALPSLHHLILAITSPALVQTHFSNEFCEGWSLNPAFQEENREQAFTRLAGSGKGTLHAPVLSAKHHAVQHLYDAGSLPWAQLLIPFEIHGTSFLGLFFPTLREWNKPILQSAADQHMYFPCSLLQATELNLFVSDTERKN